MRKILTVLLALCFSNSATYAQEFNAKGVVLTDANASIAVLGLTVEQTVGMEVFDTSGMALGVVASVIGDDQDTPTGLVLSTNGGSIMVELADVQLINNRIVVSNLAD